MPAVDSAAVDSPIPCSYIALNTSLRYDQRGSCSSRRRWSRLDEPSVTENAQKDVLPWNIPTTSYLHGVNLSSPDLSPLSADLSEMPPICVHLGADEMFRGRDSAIIQAWTKTGGDKIPGIRRDVSCLSCSMRGPMRVERSFNSFAKFMEETLVGASPLFPGEIKNRLFAGQS